MEICHLSGVGDVQAGHPRVDPLLQGFAMVVENADEDPELTGALQALAPEARELRRNPLRTALHCDG